MALLEGLAGQMTAAAAVPARTKSRRLIMKIPGSLALYLKEAISVETRRVSAMLSALSSYNSLEGDLCRETWGL
jgi:hypothetical protein